MFFKVNKESDAITNMFIKNFIYQYIIYPIIFVGVYVLFYVFKLDGTPVPINDALNMVLLYYFAISVYNALPTLKSNKVKNGANKYNGL
ncbi:hypothetical protein [Peribacillus sp. NPDC096540]|uniref:hypothetical protein n=1 Tax=Peribacillus sp. NPDC096540 TaxID=3390612 RepID=UPI003CFD1D45